MLFTTYSFAAFLAVLLLLYYLCPGKWRWCVLLTGSFTFYSLTGAANLLFILLTLGSSYLASRCMDVGLRRQKEALALHKEDWEKAAKKAYKAKEKKKRFFILIAALVFNFGLVAFLKLNLFSFGSLATKINSLYHISADWETLTLLGLSFYTFQTMGYLIEVYREKAEAEKNPLKLALFVSFFPLLVQGPICRYKDLYPQLFEPHPFQGENIRQGLFRIALGLFKQLLIAARLGEAISALSADSALYEGGYFLLLTVLYSVWIYANFTGGIDLTIGISRLFGLTVPENFRQPYFSKSIKEYWNRWHISLGEWFTDYLFYPLSVCRPMMALSGFARKHFGNGFGKRLPVYLATVVTWFVTGLWHGTAWNFIVWGLLNCLVILISQELSPLYKAFRRKFPRLTSSRLYAIFEMLRTFFLMGLIRILDVYGSVPVTFSLYAGVFLPSSWQGKPALSETLSSLSLWGKDLVILLLAVAVLLVISILAEKQPLSRRLSGRPYVTVILTLLLLLAVILFGRYGYGYDVDAFRYA